MGRRTVSAVRPRSLRARRRTVGRSLVASGIVPTYDLFYGSQCELLFKQAVMDAGFSETDRSWWPTESRALHAEGAVFREGDTGALYRLKDGTLAHVHLGNDSIHVELAGPSRGAVRAAAAAFADLYPASFVTTTDDGRVPVTFWANSAFGPQPRLRRIEASPWEPIVGNYSADVRDELAALMAWQEPGTEGQLILWQGPPGTGKTWALRALACEWAPWAEFHYITDPDSFFVDDPSYMVNVLLSDSYSVVDSEGGIYEEQAEGKWRVLILEDTGELLSANAKEKYGQGLSRLLNVVDGMIGQGLRVLCLVTTNDELGELNEAVRRPGRCASQIVFGPLGDEEARAWTGDPDATAGTIAELYSRYGKAEPRPAEFSEEPEEASDLMAAAPDVRAEIARVAEAHQPDGGYGETAWLADDRMVLWVCGDWTSNDEVEAATNAFLDIDGVDGVAYEAEAMPTGWCDAEPVYGGQPFDCGRDEDEELAAVVALAAEPLELEFEPELVAAVTEALETTPLDLPLTSDRLLDVLERFAERDAPPAPTFNLHFPQHLGVTLERQDISVPVTVEPTPVSFEVQPTPVEVIVPEQAPPTVTVQAADPAPIHLHVPEQAPPIVHVDVPAPEPRPSAIRVDFDGRGNKLFVPVHDEPEEATT